MTVPGGAPAPPASPYAARPWLASYPPGVPSDFAPPEVPLTRLLDDAAASFPARTALAFAGLRMTYRELRDATDHLASGLAGLGVRRGDRVCLVLPDCPQHVLTVFAVLRLGAVVVQHDPRQDADQLQAQLADCGARVVVCLDRQHATVTAAGARTGVQWVVVTSLADDVPALARLRARLPLPRAQRADGRRSVPLRPHGGTVSFVRLVKTPTAARQTPVDPSRSPAVLRYSGGTAGTPRPVVLTHEDLVADACTSRVWDPGSTPGAEVTVALAPLCSVLGLTVGLFATVLLAGTLVLLPGSGVDELLAALDRWRPTVLPVEPPVLSALVEAPRAGLLELSSLRVCVSSGPLSREVADRFERLSGAPVVEGYGPAGATTTHCNPVSDRRRPGSMGLPLPGTHCRVVDPGDPAREAPVGTAGELVVRGPQVPGGWWGGGPAAVTDDGWLRTGDLVTMDADGFFTLVGRGQGARPPDEAARKTARPAGR